MVRQRRVVNGLNGLRVSGNERILNGNGEKEGKYIAGAAYRRVIYRRVMCGEKGLHKRVAAGPT